MRVKAKVGWSALAAVAALGLTTWWGANSQASPWVETLALVFAALLGAFAPSCVDLARKRADARRRAKELSEQTFPQNPAGLLRADRHIVPFTGRDVEYDELREWCRDDKPPVRLVVGAGGVGKTRLALQLGEYLRSVGWSATMVAAGEEVNALTTLRGVTPRRSSIFLIVDYAETRADLVDLLRSVTRDPGHVRVLLIARSAGDWWSKLGADVPAVRNLVQAYRPLELPAQVGSASSPVDLANDAVPYFAEALGVPTPKTEITVPQELPLLTLHAAALLAVLQSQDRRTPAERLMADLGVLKELLGHEMRFWEHSADRKELGVGSVVLQRAVAVACLFGAVDESDGAKILRRVPDLRDSEGLRRQVARWLKELYPPSSGYWGSLQPELVAETHVIDQVVNCRELITTGPSELRTEQLRQMLTVLSLGATHRPAGLKLLEQVLGTDITRLVYPALEVAKATGSTLGTVLARVLAKVPLTPTTLREIQAAIPYPTTALAETAVAVTGRILDELPSSTDRAETALWHMRLGAVLAQAGRADDALQNLSTAVDHYRTLIETDRDRYLSDLARTLHYAGIQHAEQDRRAEALHHAGQAVEYFRELTKNRPDCGRPDLAAALHNRGIWLAELGRNTDAFRTFQEAVACYDALVDSDPDRYLRDRAEALAQQDLSISKQPQAALRYLEDAVEQHRVMSEADPDSYLPDLARSLYNLGSGYAAQGQLPEAEDCLLAKAEDCLLEAQAHYRSLAARLDPFRSDLAACLNNLGATIAERGRYTDAVPFAQEAVSLRQHLAETSPVRYWSELARSLDNLAFCRSKLGEHDEARKSAEEAVKLYRDLTQIAPTRYEPELARALDNLGVSLSELRRHAEALPAALEAVAIYRRLDETHSNQHRSALAQALRNLAVDHSELSQHAKADRCRQEADQICEEQQRRLEAANAGGPTEAAL